MQVDILVNGNYVQSVPRGVLLQAVWTHQVGLSERLVEMSIKAPTAEGENPTINLITAA